MTKELRALYEEAFDDDSKAFVDYFFDSIDTRRCYTVLEGNEIVSALYVTYKKCVIRGCKLDIPFFVAVATRKDKRGQGKAAECLTKALKDLYDRGDILAGLYPVNHKLYEKFGFCTVNYMSECSVSAGGDAAISKVGVLDIDRLKAIADKHNKRFDSYFVYDNESLYRLIKEYAADGVSPYIVTTGGIDLGFCFACTVSKRLEHAIGDGFGSASEWIGYKYSAPSKLGTGSEYCQMRIINARLALECYGTDRSILPYGVTISDPIISGNETQRKGQSIDIRELTHIILNKGSNNFFADKY